jgi:hypothetical protein
MKRILLLVCLIVSLTELDWERDRIYLMSSIASLLLVLGSERKRLRNVQNGLGRVFARGKDVSSEACAEYPPHLHDRVNRFERVEPVSTATQGVALMHNYSRAGYREGVDYFRCGAAGSNGSRTICETF